MLNLDRTSFPYPGNSISSPKEASSDSDSDSDAELIMPDEIDLLDLFISCTPKENLPEGIKQLFKGSQNGNAGIVPLEKAQEVFDQLISVRKPGVSFNRSRLQPDESGDCVLSGGSCSAMAFDFATKVSAILQTGQSRGNVPLNQKRKELKEHIKSLEAAYQASSELFRIKQFAFNTIEKDQETATPDFKEAKVASLAAFYNKKIVYSSDETDLSLRVGQMKVKEIVSKLPEGIFAIRALKPADNHKEEAFGHTMVFIKRQEGQFFYDPNKGAFFLKRSPEDGLLYFLKKSCDNYMTTDHRFYQLEDLSTL